MIERSQPETPEEIAPGEALRNTIDSIMALQERELDDYSKVTTIFRDQELTLERVHFPTIQTGSRDFYHLPDMPSTMYSLSLTTLVDEEPALPYRNVQRTSYVTSSGNNRIVVFEKEIVQRRNEQTGEWEDPTDQDLEDFQLPIDSGTHRKIAEDDVALLDSIAATYIRDGKD